MIERFQQQLHEAADFLRSRTTAFTPEVALILGTGLGDVSEAMQVEGRLPYQEIPHHPVSTVSSHQGEWLWGTWSGKRIVALKGRFHLYEGYTPLEISFPIRLLARLGLGTLVLSNAAGGLNPQFNAGDLMLITDHINFTGRNPLIGPNLDQLGVRFPDMTQPYSLSLRDLAEKTALHNGIALQRGVYVGVLGPSMETAAETRMLRMLGADAVGMSTIMEVIAAVHAGLEVLGISVISNVNRPDCYEPVALEQVIATASLAGPELVRLLGAILEKLEV
jgi:purine-nucleoside phosphorylase